MTLTLGERNTSRALSIGQSNTRTLKYFVKNEGGGDVDDDFVLEWLSERVPETYSGLVMQTIGLDPIDPPRLWYADVQYGAKEKKQPGAMSWNFNIGTTQQRITHSLATLSSYAPSGLKAPNFEGGIGARMESGEISLEGVDIHVPTLEWEETHSHDYSTFNLGAYVKMLYFATGRINKTAWRGFSPGEILFLGATGQPNGQYTVDITYRFAASPSVTNLRVGKISGIKKRGWDYLWVLSMEVMDPTTYIRVKVPRAVYVERVFEEYDLSKLKIRTPW